MSCPVTAHLSCSMVSITIQPGFSVLAGRWLWLDTKYTLPRSRNSSRDHGPVEPLWLTGGSRYHSAPSGGLVKSMPRWVSANMWPAQYQSGGHNVMFWINKIYYLLLGLWDRNTTKEPLCCIIFPMYAFKTSNLDLSLSSWAVCFYFIIFITSVKIHPSSKQEAGPDVQELRHCQTGLFIYFLHPVCEGYQSSLIECFCSGP